VVPRAPEAGRDRGLDAEPVAAPFLGAARLGKAFFGCEVFGERDEDDARDPPLTGVRFAVVVAPLRVFLGAMSP